MTHTAHRRVILDMDSSRYMDQEGASYNGHFGSTCYHPLFVFNQFGDCEGAMLRAGNVHSAHRWRDVLDPILSRYGATGVRRYFRADAAFAKPDIYEYLEERHVLYSIRLPGNEVLQREIAPAQEAGGQAAEASSDPIRRLLVSCRESALGGWWPRWSGTADCSLTVGFIVTNMTAGPEGVLVRFYNSWDSRAVDQGGQVRPELDSAVARHRFVANRVRLGSS